MFFYPFARLFGGLPTSVQEIHLPSASKLFVEKQAMFVRSSGQDRNLGRLCTPCQAMKTKKKKEEEQEQGRQHRQSARGQGNKLADEIPNELWTLQNAAAHFKQKKLEDGGPTCSHCLKLFMPEEWKEEILPYMLKLV
jgi:hypothetical protein